MHHSTFNPDTQPAHDQVTTTFSRTLLQANSSIRSEHIPGESNVIADSMSRDFHLCDSHLLPMLHSTHGPQMPHNLTMFPPTGRTFLLDRIALSETDIYEGVSQEIRKKQIGAFNRWQRFLQACEINDHFISDFNRLEKGKIINAFAYSIQNNEFGKTAKAFLRGETVASTINYVATTFRGNYCSNPTIDE